MPEGIAEIPDSPDIQIREKCRAVLNAGFDFTECGGGMLMGLDDDQRQALYKANEKDSLKLLAVNSLFPGSFRLSDPTADNSEYIEYAARLFGIMHELGAKYAVLGSGAARNLITGASYGSDDSFQALEGFIVKLGDTAVRNSITVVIEPLRKCETNVFNTVPESGDYVRRLNHEGVRLLCDVFHMAEEKSDPLCFRDYAELVKHCHIAESPNRSRPGADDSADLSYNRKFAVELMRSGYSGGVSVECGFKDFASDLSLSISYLREIFR